MAIIAGITRPKVLIVTPHPVIGAGIETVLRLEDLYDVRRVSTLADGMATIGTWGVDVALVDGVLLDGRAVDLGVPSYVLSGDAASGERLAEKIPGAKGWLLKDAPPARLVQAIDRAAGIVRVREDVRGTVGMVIAVLIVIAFVGAVVLFAWRFLLG
jgi:DNA-binding NarL/FixJ family response regulator